VEGLSDALFSLLLMEGEAADLEDADERRGLFNFLTIFFGRSIAKYIIENEGD
jgi:hypothetical protein